MEVLISVAGAAAGVGLGIAYYRFLVDSYKLIQEVG
jgi:hypothetical protein